MIINLCVSPEVAHLRNVGAVANWIGGLPAWLIGLFGLVFSFLIVSLFLFGSSPNPPRSTATISGSTSVTSRSATV
jgi:hypothetical protein